MTVRARRQRWVGVWAGRGPAATEVPSSTSLAESTYQSLRKPHLLGPAVPSAGLVSARQVSPDFCHASAQLLGWLSSVDECQGPRPELVGLSLTRLRRGDLVCQGIIDVTHLQSGYATASRYLHESGTRAPRQQRCADQADDECDTEDNHELPVIGDDIGARAADLEHEAQHGDAADAAQVTHRGPNTGRHPGAVSWNGSE